jgi:superfamily II DNA/RNA helicase
VQSKMESGKTLACLLLIVHLLASSTDDGRHPAPFPRRRRGGGGVDRKSGGTWCVLLYPSREPATQMHSLTNQLFRSSFPRIVPGCLSGGEKRKSEKARLCRGIILLVAMPGHLLNHLTKAESLPLSLLQTAASSGLSSTRLIAFWMGAASGGRWSRLSSGFAGDAVAQRVGSGPPGRSRACWCWRR